MAVAAEQQEFDLGKYERKVIAGTVVKLTKAGDGLSKAHEVAPEKIPLGQKRYVLTEVVSAQHTYKAIPDAPNTLQLVQTLECQTVTILDEETARPFIEAERSRQQQHAHAQEIARRAQERAESGDEDPEAEVMRRQHMAGAHEEFRDGCELCQRQRELDEEHGNPEAPADPADPETT